MVQATAKKTEESQDERVMRVYELGYQIAPETSEDNVEKAVASFRSLIEQAGGSLIAEGAPSLIKLAYEMAEKKGGKGSLHDRAFFGWIKFDAPSEAAHRIEDELKQHPSVMRGIVFRTVREETRARFKTGNLREVKRTDTLRAPLRTQEESSVPVSEEDLEKAIKGLTAE